MGVDDDVILKWILKKYGGRVWTTFIRLRTEIQWRNFVNTVMNFRLSLKN
jgi:hypothetical protein